MRGLLFWLQLCDFKLNQAGLCLLAVSGLTILGCEQPPVETVGIAKKSNADPSPASISAAETLEKMGCTLVMEAKYSGSTVTVVDFRRATDLEQGLPLLKEFDNLISLEFSGTQITDEGMKALKELVGLQQLYLRQTAITDVGLKEIRNLKKIHTLDLSSTAITDAGAHDLLELKNLTSLNLSNTDIGDLGLESLKDLPSLQRLDLLKDLPPPTAATTQTTTSEPVATLPRNLVRVTDTGTKTLKKLKKLTFLSLSGNTITNAGIKDLSELSKLETLRLDHTQVTDDGIAPLERLKSLSFIDLYDTKVTEKRAQEFKGKFSRISVNLQP